MSEGFAKFQKFSLEHPVDSQPKCNKERGKKVWFFGRQTASIRCLESLVFLPAFIWSRVYHHFHSILHLSQGPFLSLFVLDLFNQDCIQDKKQNEKSHWMEIHFMQCGRRSGSFCT